MGAPLLSGECAGNRFDTQLGKGLAKTFGNMVSGGDIAADQPPPL